MPGPVVALVRADQIVRLQQRRKRRVVPERGGGGQGELGQSDYVPRPCGDLGGEILRGARGLVELGRPQAHASLGVEQADNHAGLPAIVLRGAVEDQSNLAPGRILSR